jgi:hypothetical protein
MVLILILVERMGAPGKRRPLAGGAQFVNAAELRKLRTAVRVMKLDSSEASPMRAILLVLILVVLVLLVGVGTGFLDINQIRGAKAPAVSATGNGIVAKGGQAPAFDVETGSVKVGTKQANVTVPTLVVQPPANQAAPATNKAQ